MGLERGNDWSVRPPLRWFARQGFAVGLVLLFGIGVLVFAGARAAAGDGWLSFGGGVIAGLAASLSYVYSLWRRGQLRIFDARKVAERQARMRSRTPVYIGLGTVTAAGVLSVSGELITGGAAAFGAAMLVFGVHLIEHVVRHWRQIYEVSRELGEPGAT